MDENSQKPSPEPLSDDDLIAGLRRALDDAPPVATAGNDDWSFEESALSRYRVLRRIGAGGMGIVFEAEQQNPRRVVALKVIRPAVTSEQHLRRFELETQVLGRLHHPGIAQIFEAGTFDSGHGPQPFFALELVTGKPLTEYAAERALGLRARLELFVRICEAVHHAHQKGVVHRDLKPANILVTKEGAPKILDFGIARATDGDIQQTAQTDLGQLVGTLPYMSPEQVGGDSESIDTRSDIYTLGVVLYELLTGRLPHDFSNRSVPQIIQMIDADRPRPAGELDRRLKGDLETIIGKALEKERDRRYSSATELASDLTRVLFHEPISARPPSTIYQVQKFARRNKLVVSLTGVLFVILVVATVVTFLQATRIKDERDAARLDNIKKDEVNGFLQDLFAAANPDLGGRGAEYTLQEALDDAAARLEQSFREAPEIRAELAATIGNAYRSLGRYDEARELLDEALAIRRELYGDDHRSVAEARNFVGLAEYGESRYDEAERQLQLALSTYEALERAAPLGHSSVLHNLGSVRHAVGDLEGAVDFYSRALDLRRAENDGEGIATTLASLAAVKASLRDGTGAVQSLRDAAASIEELLGPRHPKLADIRMDLARRLAYQGGIEEAETHANFAVELTRSLFGDRHLRTAAKLRGLANVMRWKRDLDGAADAYAEAAEILRETIGERPPLAWTLEGLAEIRVHQGRPKEAETLIEEVLAIEEKFYEPDHPAVGRTLLVLADAQFPQGNLAGAVDSARRATAILEKNPGPQSPRALEASDRLARLLIRNGENAEAVTVLEQRLENLQALGGQGAEVADTLGVLSDVFKAEGNYEKAEETVRRALGIIGELSSASWRLRGDTTRRLGRVLHRAGRLAEAREELDKALSIYDGASAPTFANKVRNDLAALFLDRDELDEAERMFRLVLAATPERHPNRPSMMNNVASVLIRKDEADDACTLLEEALTLAVEIFGPTHTQTASTMFNLGRASRAAGEYEDAEARLRAAHGIWHDAFGDEHPRVALVLGAIAGTLHDDDRLDDALTTFTAALVSARAAYPPGHRSLGMLLSAHGSCLVSAQRLRDAEPLLLEAKRILEKELGKGHDATQEVIKLLVEIHDRSGRADDAAELRKLLREE